MLTFCQYIGKINRLNFIFITYNKLQINYLNVIFEFGTPIVYALVIKIFFSLKLHKIMKVLKALKNEQVNDSTQAIFSNIKKKVGKVPNLYAAMGNSPQLLSGFLAFEATLKQGAFSAKENEAIALAVSQTNQCNYCLAAHSAIGKMLGYKENEVQDIRKGFTVDPKLNALLTLATELTEKRGKAAEETINQFLAVGYTPQAFAELIGLVAVRNITNYIYSNGDFKIDFPKAANLEEIVA